MSILLYWQSGGNWWLFLLLLLAPDLSMLGYLAGPKLGASVYNTVHTYLLPAVLAVIGWLTVSELLLHLALIWFAHIGMDRLLGYGLKYSTALKDTHLSHV
jgi:hypothetical protein